MACPVNRHRIRPLRYRSSELELWLRAQREKILKWFCNCGPHSCTNVGWHICRDAGGGALTKTSQSLESLGGKSTGQKTSSTKHWSRSRPFWAGMLRRRLLRVFDRSKLRVGSIKPAATDPILTAIFKPANSSEFQAGGHIRALTKLSSIPARHHYHHPLMRCTNRSMASARAGGRHRRKRRAQGGADPGLAALASGLDRCGGRHARRGSPIESVCARSGAGGPRATVIVPWKNSLC